MKMIVSKNSPSAELMEGAQKNCEFEAFETMALVRKKCES